MIMEQIYEVDFVETSYGYRPRRSCHQALATLGQVIATRKVNWVSDADIKGFFDNADHQRLVELLQIRISDPKLLALIKRFLTAGVMIDGHFEATDDGVPQGASLSPLLANVYLIGEMWPTLNAKLRGHYQYYGINDHWPMLMAFRSKVRRMAKRHLSRRSQNSYVNWEHFDRFTDVHPLAAPHRLTDLIAMSRTGVVAGAK